MGHILIHRTQTLDGLGERFSRAIMQDNHYASSNFSAAIKISFG
jgi:hypothetical protein